MLKDSGSNMSKSGQELSHEDWILWYKLYEEYFDILFRYCAPKLDHDNDATDNCVHQIFDIAQLKIKQLRKHPNIGGWMYITAKNCIKMERRKKKLYSRGLDGDPDFLSTIASWLPIDDDYASLNDDDIDKIKNKVLGLLDTEEYLMYHLYYEKHMSLPEIAQQLGISSGAARTRLYRVRIRIKDYIKKYL